MNHIIKRLATFVAVAGLGFVSAAGVASAAKPVDGAERVKSNETFQDPGFAEFLSFACGVANVDVTVTEKLDIWVSEAGASGHANVKTVITNTDTGQYVTQSVANQFASSATEVVGDDGLLHVDAVDVNKGLALKWQAPGQGVIVRDAGNITILTSLVVDLSIDPEVADPVISFEQTIDSKGPHPWAEQGFGPTPEQAEAICGAIGGTDVFGG